MLNVYRHKVFVPVLLDSDISELKEYIYYNMDSMELLEPYYQTLYLVTDSTSVLLNKGNLTRFLVPDAKRIVMFHLDDIFTLKKSSFVPIMDLSQVYKSPNKRVYYQEIIKYGFDITMNQFEDYIKELFRERVLKQSSNMFAELRSSRENKIKIYNDNHNNKILRKKLLDPLLNTSLNLESHLDETLFSYIQMYMPSGEKGRYIKLKTLFDKFTLSETVPFMGINGVIVGDAPKFRSLESFDIPQGWMVNEKKQTNEYSYKNIRGVLLKVLYNGTYLSVNIDANGDIYVTLDLERRNISGGIISRQSVEYITEIPYDGIFSVVNPVVEEVNGLPIFSKFLLKKLLKERMKLNDLTVRYVLKQRINKSGLVKAFSNFPENDIFQYRETKGKETLVSIFYNRVSPPLVINIEDNMHKKGSILSVFKCENLNQPNVILRYILQISKVKNLLDTDKSVQKLSPDTVLKSLKKENIKIDSRSCQKPRQPQISSAAPLKDAYALEYNDKRYLCKKPEYKYPGFTSKNVICCFKKDQRNNKYYIQNTLKSDINVFVSPSNYFLEEFQTFLLKKDSEYVILRDSGLEVIPEKPEYIQIEFLPMVTLAQLRSLPKKTNCAKLPDMSKPESERCQAHKIQKVYGYTSFSFPCCFENLDNVIALKSKSQEHIFSKNIILPDQREGKLFGLLDLLFNNVISDNEFERYYRLGVIRDNYSLLRALMYTTGTMESIDSLIKKLVKFVTNDTFRQLGNGQMAITFEYQEYIEKLRRFELKTTYILDLLNRFFDVNTILIDNDSEQIICTPNMTLDSSKPYVILLRHSVPEHYEIIIQKQINKITKRFTRKNKCIVTLREYYKSTCKQRYASPSGYKYSPLVDYKSIKGKFTIKYQVVNKFDKVYLLITNVGPLPIQQIEILPNVKKITMDKLKSSFTYESLDKSIKNVNKITPLSIDSQIVNGGKTIGVLTSVGVVLPIKEREVISNLPVSELRWYYGDEDNYIYDRSEDRSRRINFWNSYKQLHELVETAKEKLQGVLSEYLEEYSQLLKDPSVSLRSKFAKVYKLVQGLIPEETHFVHMIIARDITLDPEYSTLFYETAIVDSGTLLESILDIRNYLAKKTTDLPLVL